ncbi:hypothetical protein ABTY20_13940 [Streptomyces sp. NPDC126497]|uniref:hypothetical protein n=1 Tax=Streptomyces sp. NPDC126497 TaxID=3155313 RepID=UPI00331EBE1B
MVTMRFSGPALAVAALMSVAARGGSSEPEAPAGAASGAESRRAGAVETSPPADAAPVAAVMPDVTGGNARRAHERMGSGLDMVFADASGRGRPVDDPAAWKVCGSRPGPDERTTGHCAQVRACGPSASAGWACRRR